jgi:hypothetical protein
VEVDDTQTNQAVKNELGEKGKGGGGKGGS